MTNATVKKRKWRKVKLLGTIALGMCILFSACSEKQAEVALDIATDVLLDYLQQDGAESQPQQENLDQTKMEGEMSVHFIEVGQADATLFVQDGSAMLFDAATKSRGDEIAQYIKNLGIDKIDVLVLSHPHEDHMGGAAEVLNNIEVGRVYGPDIFDIKSLANLQWYNNMIDAIDRIDEENNKGVEANEQTSIWHFPRNDKDEFAKFNIGDAKVEFYAPLEDEYSDMNDYSICAKVTYGTIDVLLTGDATTKVEKDLINEGYDLDVEIYQAAHHGSDSSNSKEFLEAMSPECIVISCGRNNKYNHPVESVIKLYEAMKIPVYRTDESGSIVMNTDGTEYSFDKEPGTYTSGEQHKEKGTFER